VNILGFQVFSLNVAILTRFSVLLGCLNFSGIDGYYSSCVEVVFVIFLGLLLSELLILFW
jgi:hypothetical protein